MEQISPKETLAGVLTLCDFKPLSFHRFRVI